MCACFCCTAPITNYFFQVLSGIFLGGCCCSSSSTLLPWFRSARPFISQVPELLNSGFHLNLNQIFIHNSTNIVSIKHFTSFPSVFDIISAHYTIIINDRINSVTLITIIHKLKRSNFTNLYMKMIQWCRYLCWYIYIFLLWCHKVASYLHAGLTDFMC